MKKFTLLNHTVFQHVVFWLMYFSFNVLRWGSYFDDFEYSFQSNLVEFSLHLIVVYFNLYYLLPRFFPQKMFKYVSLLAVFTMIVSSIRILLTYQLVTTEVWKEASVSNLDLFDPNYFMAVFIGEIYVVGLTMAIKLGIDYVRSINRTKELENKRLEAELSFLRSQIQPHFFFNTLNNLYALSLIKSEKAPETILKLSELMSYVIYQGKSKRVKLSSEIKHIHDYLDLERIRYSDKLEINIEINGTMEGHYMPPLILIPFIENCFKHGNTQADKIPIDIKIHIEPSKLVYSVKNEISSENENLEKDKRNGIGIKNLRRRLDLLFNENYSLEIQQDMSTFTVNLSMPLYDKKSDS